MHLDQSMVNKFSRYLFGIVLCGAALAGSAQAQSAVDGFDPHANGPVRAIALQADGKILIGGEFTSLAPNGGAAVTRNHIARLNPDGKVDLTFNPDANGDVYTIAIQNNGAILIGGSFTAVGGTGRNFLARLNSAGGSLDTSFNTDPVITAGTAVYAILVQPDGRIVVGGKFNSSVMGASNCARFLITGAADNFAPFANDAVRALALQTNGKIVIGGDFVAVGMGLQRRFIARLFAATGAPDYFDPDANGPVHALAIQGDNKILLGGLFTTVGGQSQGKLSRIDPLTGASDGFRANAQVGQGDVYSIAVQPDCKILLGGNFEIFGVPPGTPPVAHAGIVRVNFDGAHDLTFKLNVPPVYAIAVQPDRKIVFGGAFVNLGSAEQTQVSRWCIARYESDGKVEQTVSIANDSNIIGAVALQSDGKVILGGDFTTINGQPRRGLVRLNTDLSVDQSLDLGLNGSVQAVLTLPNGDLIVAGDFTTANPNGSGTISVSRIVRVSPLGVIDPTFIPTFDVNIFEMLLQPDGKFLVAGNFTQVNGQARSFLVRLNPNGTTDLAFNPAPNDGIRAMEWTSSGIYVGGNFSTIGGQNRSRAANLDLITGAALSFNPNPTTTGGTLSVDSFSNQLYGLMVGGQYATFGGLNRIVIARLNGNSVDTTFVPNLVLNSLANQPGVGTSFAGQVNGFVFGSGAMQVSGAPTTERGLLRFNPFFGTVDATFNSAADAGVRGLALQLDGKLWVVGNFTGIGGPPRKNVARLTNITPAAQTLTIDPSAATWTLTGSMPYLSRVFYEQSSDGINYSYLGEATLANQPPATNIWSLSNPALINSPVIYVRARGLFRSGFFNGSSSLIESVGCYCAQLPAGRAAYDFDGDGRADIGVFRPSEGNWYFLRSGSGQFAAQQFGAPGDVTASADYDGDGKFDVAVFRPATGTWYWVNSSNGSFSASQFGQSGDIPSAGDRDGDGRADITVFRPSNGTFYWLQSSNNAFRFQQWGAANDIPLPGDYDADGRTDFAVFRPNTATFFLLRTSDGSFQGTQFGTSGDRPVSADWDGDGAADLTVFRPATGDWFYLQSTNGEFRGVNWGTSGDLPAVADYDGDGKWDVTVFRPSTGIFYVLPSQSKQYYAQPFGSSGDRPVAYTAP